MTGKNTLNRSGYVWIPPERGDGEWATTIDDKFVATTWKFGNIHQCKIFVKYEHRINGIVGCTHSYAIGEDYQAICLGYGKTRDKAMQKMVDWIHDYQKAKPVKADTFIKQVQKNWPDLYDNRMSVLEQLFFTIGGGYGWLDGAMFDITTQDYDPPSKEETARLKKEIAQEKRRIDKLDKALKKYGVEKEKNQSDQREEDRELLWKADTYPFYPASESYSKVCLVPDDVRPDWLKVAHEAALLLRDHSGVPDIKMSFLKFDKEDIKRQEENRKIGTKVVKELENRFPQLKGKDATKNKQVSA